MNKFDFGKKHWLIWTFPHHYHEGMGVWIHHSTIVCLDICREDLIRGDSKFLTRVMGV